MTISEELKTISDKYAKLGFLLETSMRFAQTNECKEIADLCIQEAHQTALSLEKDLSTLNLYKTNE